MKKMTLRRLLCILLCVVMAVGFLPSTAFATETDNRITITKVSAVSDNFSPPTLGAKVRQVYSYSITEGHPARISTRMCWWYKKVGDELVRYTEDVFTPGSYRHTVQVRIDGDDGAIYKLGSPFVLTVNGTRWDLAELKVADDYSYLYALSIEYVVTEKEPLKFTKQPTGGSANKDDGYTVSWELNDTPDSIELCGWNGARWVSLGLLTGKTSEKITYRSDIQYYQIIAGRGQNGSGLHTEIVESDIFYINWKDPLKFTKQPTGGNSCKDYGYTVSWELNDTPDGITLLGWNGSRWLSPGMLTGKTSEKITYRSDIQYYKIRAGRGQSGSGSQTEIVESDIFYINWKDPLKFTKQPTGGNAYKNYGYTITWELNDAPDAIELRGWNGARWLSLGSLAGKTSETIKYRPEMQYYQIMAGRGRDENGSFTEIIRSDRFSINWIDPLEFTKQPTGGRANKTDGYTISWELNDTPDVIELTGFNGTNWLNLGSLAGKTSETITYRSDIKYYQIVAGRGLDEHGYLSEMILSDCFSIDWYDSNEPDLAQPDVKLTNQNGSVKISWNRVTNAAKYAVYIRANGTWKKLGETSSTSYVYSDALTSGSNYSFTVRAINGSASSTYGSFSIKYLAQPAVKLANQNGSVKLSWNTVGGAAKYFVYLRSGNSWTKLGETTSTSYNYSSGLTSGSNYTFTVKAVNGSYSSAYGSFAIKYLAQPAVKLANENGSVKLSWNTVGGAAKYFVYLRSGNSWTKLGETTSTSYSYSSGLTSGSNYTFTVKAVNGSYSSAYGSFAIKYLAQPAVKLANQNGSVKLSWNSVGGAAKYFVYLRSGSSWTRLGETTSTSYSYSSGLTSGSNYTFTVKAVNGSYSSAYGSFAIKYLAQPTLSSVTRSGSNVVVKWASVPGAVSYTVYRKDNNGGWVQIGTASGTSYTDLYNDSSALTKGHKYTYTVRAVNGSYISGYDTAGKALNYN